MLIHITLTEDGGGIWAAIASCVDGMNVTM